MEIIFNEMVSNIHIDHTHVGIRYGDAQFHAYKLRMNDETATTSLLVYEPSKLVCYVDHKIGLDGVE